MKSIETDEPDVAADLAPQVMTEQSPEISKQCPTWCRTHAANPEGGVSHCRLIETITIGGATGQYLEIAVVQQEGEDGWRPEPSIYMGVHGIREHKIVRHTAESAHTLSEIVDAATRNNARANLLRLLDDAVMRCLPVGPKRDCVDWLERLPIALRKAAHTIASRRTPCPSWCVEEHTAHWDTLHVADSYAIPLSRYPYWFADECVAATMSVGLWQDQDDQAPIIVFTSHDDAVEEQLTVGEAEDLGNSLLHMVAIARGEE